MISYPFLIQSAFLTPHDVLNLLISSTFTISSKFFIKAHTSLPYMTDETTIPLKIPIFTLTESDFYFHTLHCAKVFILLTPLMLHFIPNRFFPCLFHSQVSKTCYFLLVLSIQTHDSTNLPLFIDKLEDHTFIHVNSLPLFSQCLIPDTNSNFPL